MNKRRTTKKHLTAIAIIATALLTVACQRSITGTSKHLMPMAQADSLVYNAMDSDYNHALLLVDSLEDIGALSEAKLCFYRAQIFFKMGQELSAELYYKKALATDELFRERPEHYYFAYDQLSTILTIKGDQQGALATATKGYGIVQNDETPIGQHWKAVLLHDIGYCQMQLGRTVEAEKNFTHAYNTLKRLASQTGKYDEVYAWARVAYNIMDAYTTTDNFEEGEKWVVAAEEAINRLVSMEECPKNTAEEYLGSLNTHKAIVLVKTGQRQKAEEVYKQFLKSEYAETSIGLVDNSEYLEKAERWTDLANLTPRLDSLATSWAMPKSMYYLKTYLVPFFNAYMKSGRHEKAMQTAQRIAEAIDSVDEYERKHNAAELAIIYETQEKEAKIAEQAADINQQRIFAVAATLLLFIIFLFIYTGHRYRAAKKLAEKNRELEQKNEELTLANTRAEESSRMKTNFIRQISHEIRTPLNILNGFTQVITSPDAEQLKADEKADIQHRIAENTDRITSLVNKMLELSEASSQTIIDRTDDAPAMLIATQAVDSSGIRKSAHIQFSMQDNEEVSNTILHTNLRYATRALAQLLDNAQKFTEKGFVRLQVQQQDGMMAYIVEDSGKGIPSQEAEHIFAEFVQLDEYYDGTGIGLTVARSIARRLGGDIRFDASYSGGARFVMTLPL
jgi:signal transduction histidine kinase